ncbi:PLP-dependent aminotransferase family protein [Rhodoferax sp.]|uniref:aminotransferase-like domain-containing protein n=1 Tax=Rhodoferax sp. TaxID=50421 RepID=UPI00374CEBCA
MSANPIDHSAPLGAHTTLVDQLVQWAEQRIQQQVFRPGMRMPSVRQLAEERGVSRFTVVAAYEKLVARGHLLARRGAGFFVREATPAASHQGNARAKSAPARVKPQQAINMGWMVRNMTSGIPSDLSPGSGYLPPDMCGGDLLKMGLRALASHSTSHQLAQGASAQGYAPLRTQIQRTLAEREIQAHPSQILTTNGAAQAIDLIFRMVLRPGDTVLVGEPGWCNPLLGLQGVEVVGVPYTLKGPDVQALTALVEKHKPKLMFLNPVLHNPTGTLLSAATAYQILRLAEAHDILVIEDDIYSDFLPPGMAVTRLASLDQLRRVVYVNSYSKMLAPNIRVGYLAGPAELVDTLTTHKLLTALTTPEINERIVYKALTEGSYRKHCQRVHATLDSLREPAFKRMQDLGLQAFCQPQAGFLGWFNTGVDTNHLAALGLDAGYLLRPGALFSLQQTPSPWMGINIATSHDPGMLAWLDKTLNQLRRRSEKP